jgi:hypothetical protein
MRDSGLAAFLPDMLRRNGIEQVELRTVERAPSLQRRATSPQLDALIDQAREAYKASRVTFWEELMRLAESAPSAVRREIFAQALYHRDETEGQVDTWCALEQFLADLEHGKYESLPGRLIVALTSRVRVQRADLELHIPMVDFRLDSGTANDKLAVELLRALGTPGYLVDSGRSYHFYGQVPVLRDNFWRFLGRAQLMSHFADQRWIGHQLISGKAALRISRGSGEGGPARPRFVAQV